VLAEQKSEPLFGLIHLGDERSGGVFVTVVEKTAGFAVPGVVLLQQ
jgi:hypothetical protein